MYTYVLTYIYTVQTAYVHVYVHMYIFHVCFVCMHTYVHTYCTNHIYTCVHVHLYLQIESKSVSVIKPQPPLLPSTSGAVPQRPLVPICMYMYTCVSVCLSVCGHPLQVYMYRARNSCLPSAIFRTKHEYGRPN